MLPGEEWRPVTAWPAYDVSRLGRVRSVTRILGDGRRAGGKVLSQSRDSKGYWRVTLRNGPLRRTVRVHVLVAEAFIQPRPAGMQVLHKEDDHDRNDSGSLRYGTEKQNKTERMRRERRERKEGRNRKVKGGQVRTVESAVPDSGVRGVTP